MAPLLPHLSRPDTYPRLSTPHRSTASRPGLLRALAALDTRQPWLSGRWCRRPKATQHLTTWGILPHIMFYCMRQALYVEKQKPSSYFLTPLNGYRVKGSLTAT